MKLPFLKSVVPPHVFCVQDDGVTYARVRRAAPVGFEEARRFAFPAGSVAKGASGSVVVSREALAEAVRAARALSGGALKRASVVVPDDWARILPVEMESLPTDDDAGRDMILWKLKKLIPGIPPEMEVVYEPMPVLSDEKRVLVAALPREAVDAIERSFDELGVRVGYIAPASLALLEGLAPAFAAASKGDYALLHRSREVLTFLIVRGVVPIFFRQRPGDEDEEHDREARLSLSYYAERLKGPGLSAVYVHDDRPERPLEKSSAFAVPPTPVSGALFAAESGFDERIAARPELLAGFAAVYGR